MKKALILLLILLLPALPGTGGEAEDIYAARYEAAEVLRADGATR